MTARARGSEQIRRWFWWLMFVAFAGYVIWRMGGFVFASSVPTPGGPVVLPDTFASVDHPFHVARAETLWRQLQDGQLLRWVGQHQGGYPVEFYPLGEAWLEVGIRALSFGALTAEAAHTLSVVAIFLLPGAAIAALTRVDGVSPAAALLAFALHLSLPGGWYDGGYTELVQWGLVTNVAGAVAVFLAFPLLIRFLAAGAAWAGALSAAISAAAIYANPRSLIALFALGAGAWVAVVLDARPEARGATIRLLGVALAVALLAAPELLSLLRFGGLYTFVQYSGYETVSEYLSTSISSVGPFVVVLALGGVALAFVARGRLATRAAAAALVVYVALTAGVAFVPVAAQLASQLEPTRLMPVQRLLTIYLAASAVWAAAAWVGPKVSSRHSKAPGLLVAGFSASLLLVLTRPLAGPPPDPASPEFSPVGLYPVARSAVAVQADLAEAVREANSAAEPGTAMLVLGSALSWHQQLWAPLWTTRPLYYDNWLWYWHPYHAGTPGYVASAGHHYPDPERTLDGAYLERHGIGAVVVTGVASDAAAASSLLRPLREGIYDAYVVRTPSTVITFGGADARASTIRNQRLEGSTLVAGGPVVVRQNWHPRWAATVDNRASRVVRRDDGYLETALDGAARQVDLRYTVQGPDWVARGLAVAGMLALVLFVVRTGRRGTKRWYPPVPGA